MVSKRPNIRRTIAGQRVWDDSRRNTPEVTGTWKQYSCRKISGAFQSLSCTCRQKLVGNHRKKSGNFPAGILLPCSGDFRCIPAGSSVFSISFLQVHSGSSHRNLRPGMPSKNFLLHFPFS